MPSPTPILALLLAGCGARPPALEEAAQSPIAHQQELAAVAGPDQTLEQVRLASLALAAGNRDLAEHTLRQAVGAMQDFRAEGQFRAIVGAERAKEWKGEPYEKMMAFLYLGVMLYEEGDYGNALAMTKSAILADTGTTVERYRSDFVPAFVLQALCYDALGEKTNAERSIGQAVDALWMRAMIDHLTALLDDDGRSTSVEDTARLLLLSGLPAGLTAHPRDPQQALEGALSYASDLRRVALEGKKKDWPDPLSGVRRSDVDAAFEHLEPMTRRWQQAWQDLPDDVLGSLASDETFLVGLLDDPGVVLWVERGVGPRKVAEGEYGEILRIRPQKQGTMPAVALDGKPIRPHYVDSVTYQAQTRGGRRVDGFLKGKAVFKDSAWVLGWGLLAGGDVANALDDDRAAAILYAAGIVTWVAGAATNPRADTRQWEHLPDSLWLVRADPLPGAHTLTVDDRTYTVEVPDTRGRGAVTVLLPRLAPGGPKTFGTPCRACDVPLAIPDAGASP